MYLLYISHLHRLFRVDKSLPIPGHRLHILRPPLPPPLAIPKPLPHPLRRPTPLRTVPEPLNDRLDPLRLIHIRKTRRILLDRPRSKLVPAAAHTLLAQPRGRIGIRRGVHGRVVGFAEDVLKQVIHAMDEVRVAVELGLVVLSQRDPAADFAQAVHAVVRVQQVDAALVFVPEEWGGVWQGVTAGEVVGQADFAGAGVETLPSYASFGLILRSETVGGGRVEGDRDVAC